MKAEVQDEADPKACTRDPVTNGITEESKSTRRIVTCTTQGVMTKTPELGTQIWNKGNSTTTTDGENIMRKKQRTEQNTTEISTKGKLRETSTNQQNAAE
jgi:hypothetical protein